MDSCVRRSDDKIGIHSSATSLIGLGPHSDVTLAQAREKATRYRQKLSEGIDPQLYMAETKRKLFEEQVNTFRAVAELWVATKKGALKARTISDNWQKLEKYIMPTLGEVPIKSITAPIAIAALRPTEQRGRLEVVKRCSQLMNEILNFAVNSGLVHANPLTGIRSVFQKPIVTHLRALQPHENKVLLQALAYANVYLITRCLIEWQLHTMVRPAEASGAKWSEIDIEKGIWIIPVERMKMKKEHRVPLTKQALAILEMVKPLSGRSEFVFPSTKKYRKSTDPETINRALGRMGLKDRTTAHGLRSLASTTLNEKGFNPDVIEAALAHSDKNTIRSAYNRTTYFEQRVKMMQWWSDHISASAVGSYQVIDCDFLKS
ncbi:DUF4102 domain-containing protein [Parashewanella spongiae]|uniref:DUF4102 domain-containing protein n=1 Tax=Parashewanella spongiae TaxID=342950 RepID=A0A3A6TNX9_9GAMM|nr:tyrosine-type recombinase/integrase [Parashewanella spongiae]RJY13167.1 DUF4102 domain-containing protein [Parashewanella spongiae]